jgi:hypothetical protein
LLWDQSYTGHGASPIGSFRRRANIKACEGNDKETTMGENKGKGTKGRSYDELSGVGTSAAGVTGTTGNLNKNDRDGGVGMPPPGDTGNRQNANLGEHGDTPALGGGGHGHENRQSAGQGQGGGRTELGPGDKRTDPNPKLHGSVRKGKG